MRLTIKSLGAGCLLASLAFRAGVAGGAPDGNSWYGDGVQVGALARAQLAAAYANSGRTGDAQKLAEELRSQFPGAVDHSGALLRVGLETPKQQRTP